MTCIQTIYSQGTTPFVAVEVAAQAYLFQPIRERLSTEPPVTITKREFRYNPLHDLETIWWDALYFVVNRTVEDSEKHTYNHPAQCALADELFYECHGRSMVMLTSGLPSRLRCLHPSLANISAVLEQVRRIIQNAYITSEAPNESIKFKVADPINIAIRPYFDRISKYLEDRDIQIRPLFDTTDKPSPR